MGEKHTTAEGKGKVPDSMHGRAITKPIISFLLLPAPHEGKNRVIQRGRKQGDCTLRKVQAGDRKRDLNDLEGGWGGDRVLPGITIRVPKKTQGQLSTETKAIPFSPFPTLVLAPSRID